MARGIGKIGKNSVVGVAGLASNVAEGVAATLDTVADVGGRGVATAGSMAKDQAGALVEAAQEKRPHLNWWGAAASEAAGGEDELVPRASGPVHTMLPYPLVYDCDKSGFSCFDVLCRDRTHGSCHSGLRRPRHAMG
eukprot:COSAG01_NODE_116_length_25522_cov_187.094403_5_plen_137_part_00